MSSREFEMNTDPSLRIFSVIGENGAAVWPCEALPSDVKSCFCNMRLARDGGSMRSLIRNLIRLHSTRVGEEYGGHSTAWQTGATEDRVPTARQRVCLYNSDTAGGVLERSRDTGCVVSPGERVDRAATAQWR